MSSATLLDTKLAKPLTLPGLFAEARQHHAEGRLLQAAELYKLVLASHPTSQTALLGLSLIARQSNQFEPALDLAKTALSLCPVSSPESALAVAHLGHCLYAMRRIPQAEAAFYQALPPATPESQSVIEAQLLARVGVGELLCAAARPGEAAAHFREALRVRPSLAAAHYGLGSALALQAVRIPEIEAALTSFETSASIAPNSPDVHFAIGFLSGRLGRHSQSIQGYRQAVRLRPAFASAWLNLGVALVADGREQQADACYRQALAVLAKTAHDQDPTRVSAYLNSGHLARSRHRFDQACDFYRQALQIAAAENPIAASRRAEVFVAFTYLHLEQSHFPQAWEALRNSESAESACAPKTRNAEIANARGILLLAEDYELNQAEATLTDNHPASPMPFSPRPVSLKIDAAITAFREAESLGHKTAASNRGNALLRVGRCVEALAAHQTSFDLDPTHPGVRYNLALTQLRLGDYTNGWPNYEIRWAFREVHASPRRFAQPRWQGQHLPQEAIQLLIYSEQGLGDTVQFLRYLPMVIGRLAQPLQRPPDPAPLPEIAIIFEVQAPLFSLMKWHLKTLERDFPGLKTEAVIHNEPLPRFTHHCPLLSLPAVFNTTLRTIPVPTAGRTGYLSIDPDLVARRIVETTDLSKPGKARIGLAWAGNPNYRADRDRSTHLATFTPLLQIENIQWLSLQKGKDALQIQSLPQPMRPMDASSNDHDLADAAALIATLDLVITTDTVIAHLAGALGKPLWLLLPWQSDWRWMQDAVTSPWYPTARLFRQAKPKDWPSLVDRVAVELAAWLALVGGPG